MPLGVGLGGAALAWLATPLLTDRQAPRIAFTVASSAGGIFGFFAQRPGKPIPDNIAANKATTAAWQGDMQRATDEQRHRRPGPRSVIETGRPSVRR